jgi:pyruvate dehydrogenase E1 component alpha subunit
MPRTEMTTEQVCLEQPRLQNVLSYYIWRERYGSSKTRVWIQLEEELEVAKNPKSKAQKIASNPDEKGIQRLGREKLLAMYKRMLLIRYFEVKTHELFAKAEIPGFIHLYAGEEAVAVGACASLQKNDYITSTHRGHGHCIAKGADVKLMMAELFGKRTGYCKGKGGSMHIADLDMGILGVFGIVGGGIPIATGAALSIKYRGTGEVAVSFFGDGATNLGAFHESVNLASIWDLPIVFICENNQYAQSTRQSYAMKVKNVADRAVAYGIPGAVVDGMDVISVYDAVSEAVRRAREGSGPTLLECKTYRFYAHYEGDAQKYRTQEEIEKWKSEKDPIAQLRSKLIDSGISKEEELTLIDNEAKKEIEDAVVFAKASPWPNPEETLEDVYVSYP